MEEVVEKGIVEGEEKKEEKPDFQVLDEGYEGFCLTPIDNTIVGKYYQRVLLISISFKNLFLYDGCEFLLHNGKRRYRCIGLVWAKGESVVEVVTIDQKNKKPIALHIKQIKEVSEPPREATIEAEEVQERERQHVFDIWVAERAVRLMPLEVSPKKAKRFVRNVSIEPAGHQTKQRLPSKLPPDSPKSPNKKRKADAVKEPTRDQRRRQAESRIGGVKRTKAKAKEVEVVEVEVEGVEGVKAKVSEEPVLKVATDVAKVAEVARVEGGSEKKAKARRKEKKAKKAMKKEKKEKKEKEKAQLLQTLIGSLMLIRPDSNPLQPTQPMQLQQPQLLQPQIHSPPLQPHSPPFQHGGVYAQGVYPPSTSHFYPPPLYPPQYPSEAEIKSQMLRQITELLFKK